MSQTYVAQIRGVWDTALRLSRQCPSSFKTRLVLPPFQRSIPVQFFLKIMTLALGLPDPFHGRFPAHTILDKLLGRRLQLGLVQVEIVHCADAQDAVTGETGTDAVHEGAAGGAEVVRHGVARGDGF